MEAVTNTQNDGLYTRDAGDLPEGSRTHLSRMKPAAVMVCATVVCDRSKFRLAFVYEGVMVYTQVYIKMLIEKVLLWIIESFGNHCFFTLDGAPPYTSN